MSDALGMLETIGANHKTYLEHFVANIRMVTKEDIKRVAQTYFIPKNRTVAILVPENNQNKETAPHAK